MKYLIVDDNPNVRKIIREAICDINDETVECENGRSAVLAYTQQQPDYVIMDIQMPVMDGLLATKNIIKQFPNAKIIIVTDYDKPSFHQATFNAGAIALISKNNLLEAKEFINNLVSK